MMRSLWISKTGMEGQQAKLDAIANNLANVATNGYKRSGVVFEDLMYQNLRQTGAAAAEQSQLPTGLQLGLGVRAAATSRNFSQGTLTQTGAQFDVAIEGPGFLQVQLPDGTIGYTRDGGLQLSNSGQLVTSAGYTVDGSRQWHGISSPLAFLGSEPDRHACPLTLRPPLRSSGRKTLGTFLSDCGPSRGGLP